MIIRDYILGFKTQSWRDLWSRSTTKNGDAAGELPFLLVVRSFASFWQRSKKRSVSLMVRPVFVLKLHGTNASFFPSKKFHERSFDPFLYRNSQLKSGCFAWILLYYTFSPYNILRYRITIKSFDGQIKLKFNSIKSNSIAMCDIFFSCFPDKRYELRTRENAYNAKTSDF